MNFVKKHKLSIVLLIIIITVIGIFSFLLKDFLFSFTNGNTYGTRLDDVAKITFKETEMDEIKSRLKENELVTSVTKTIHGKIISFTIVIESEMDVAEARKLSTVILEEVSGDILENYDTQIFIQTKGDSDMYPIIGYKHRTSEIFMWTYYNKGDQNEK